MRLKIEGLKPCKLCNVFPDIKYSQKYFDFTCPKCGRRSATHSVHGIEIAIEDWNRYHSKKLDCKNSKLKRGNITMIDGEKLKRYIKAEINPYGKPFEGNVYEFGLKLIEHIERMEKLSANEDRKKL